MIFELSISLKNVITAAILTTSSLFEQTGLLQIYMAII